MDRARLDKAMETAFEREYMEMDPPRPHGAELARALHVVKVEWQPGGKSGARQGLRTAVLSAALAAACILPGIAGVVFTGTSRPLAVELSASIPGDSGERFTSFMLAVGASLRSAN